MTYPTRIDICDGKYTVIYDLTVGQSECLRNGQPWRDLCGDKMVMAMFDEIVELRQKLEVANTLSVTHILLEVVPGEDGMGQEIYAKSVADVEALLSRMGEQLEDYASLKAKAQAK